MADTRVITDAEWEVHRTLIEKLYQDTPLSEVMASMKQDHGFIAKKAQYTRKFKQWNLSKNSTSDKWNFVARKVEKRKLEGKESEIHMNGKLVPSKKARKEISRHPPPSYYGILDAAPSPQAPPGVQVRTPRGESGQGSRYINFLQIPWFQFDDFIRADVELHLSKFHQQYPAFSPLREQQWSSYDIDSQRAFEFGASGLDSTRYVNPSAVEGSANRNQNSLATRPSNREIQSIFARVMGNCERPDEAITTLITSRLDGYLPEREEGELEQNASSIFDLSSIADPSLQLLRYAVFLSSNNLLSDERIDKLLKWMIDTHQSFLIERLIKIKINTPTVEIFLSHLLISATRLREFDLVRTLLTYGVDVNTPAGCPPTTTALYCAARNQDLRLVRLLLNAGANPNPSLVFPLTKCPLQASVRSPMFRLLPPKDYHQLVQMLLDSGANVNVLPVGFWTPHSILTAAILNGDAELVRILLKSKAEVNMMTESSITALQAAASIKDLEILHILIEAGADVNAPFGNRYSCARFAAAGNNKLGHLISPIQRAAYNDNIEMVQVMLDSGADADGYIQTEEEQDVVDSKEEDDFFDMDLLKTPLQLAVSNQNFIMARLLLSSGANANAKHYGNPPLQIAAQKADVALARLLLRNGADVNTDARRYGGWLEGTAIQAAANSGNPELVQLLLDVGADVNALPACKGGRTCLQAAGENGYSEMIGILLEMGAEVNAPPAYERGRTALQAAIQHHNNTSIDILLKSGANINAAPSPVKGVSALYAAIRHNDLTLVRQLLKFANPDGAASRHPPIVKAARNGNLDIVQSLIEAGADVNAFTFDAPETPLVIAVGENRSDMVQLLLANGASVNPVSSASVPDLTALGTVLCKFPRNKVKVEDLITAGADVNQGSRIYGLPLLEAIKDIHLTKLLLDAGANVNGQWPGKPTALQEACSLHNIDTIKLLLDSGADVNAPAYKDRGRTALQAAVEHGNLPVIKLLLDYGADCNAPAAEAYGGTALQLAAIKGTISVILLLLRAGAEINAEPSKKGGKTALEGAAEHGRLDVVSLILNNDTDGDAIEARCQRAAKLAAANGHVVISRILKEYKKKDH